MPPDQTAHEGPSWGAFALWAVFGCVALIGVLILGTFALVAVAVAVWLLTRTHVRHSVFGFLVGLGAASLFIAYLHRKGPGTVCWQTATASGCDEYENPWIWLAVAIALVIAGLALHVRRLHRGLGAGRFRLS